MGQPNAGQKDSSGERTKCPAEEEVDGQSFPAVDPLSSVPSEGATENGRHVQFLNSIKRWPYKLQAVVAIKTRSAISADCGKAS